MKDNNLMIHIYHSKLSYHSLEESVAYSFMDTIGMQFFHFPVFGN